jgi:hypothetical protein
MAPAPEASLVSKSLERNGAIIMSTDNRTIQLAADQKLIAGVQKYVTSTQPLTIGSQSVTPTAIVATLQSRITAGQAVVTAEAARTAAVKANLALRAQTGPFVASLRRYVVAMYEQSPDTLAYFGLTAPKVAKKNVATKATAVAKTQATRAARHTMGSQQKKAVKGEVPSVGTSSGASAPPTPAVTAKPAT